MSRYLQRLAQRSGLVVGGGERRASAVGSTVSTGVSTDNGIEVIDEVLTVSQPRSAELGSSRGDTAEFVDRTPSQLETDAAAAVGNEGASLAAHESIETTVPKSAVPAASQPRSPMGPMPAEDRFPIDPKGPAAYFDKASESRGPTPGPDVAETPGASAEPELAVGPIAPVTRPGSAEGPIEGPMEGPTEIGQTPSGRVDQAIQWVMDDPHWTEPGQGMAVAPDRLGLDAVETVVEASSPRRGAEPSLSKDFQVGPNKSVDEGSLPSNQEQTRPEVQLHIGRIAIEVHQSESPVQTLQPPTVANKPSTQSRAGSSSDSRLRRLYLRGF